MNKVELGFEHPFHSSIREYIICLLLFLTLCGLSYLLISYLRVPLSSDNLYTCEQSDYAVYQTSTWICTFALAVSLAAIMLIPFSILSNELLVYYPNSFYFRWLNSSLLRSRFNFFWLQLLESHSSNNLLHSFDVMPRIVEASLMCAFTFGLTILAGQGLISLFVKSPSATLSLKSLCWWFDNLPEVYSCISLSGMGVLLTCTPIGLGRIFTAINEIVQKPKDSAELLRKLSHLTREIVFRKRILSRTWMNTEVSCAEKIASTKVVSAALELYCIIWDELCGMNDSKLCFSWIKYVTAAFLLVVLSSFSMILVIMNVLQLITGLRRLPSPVEEFELGKSSLSFLGIWGAALEIIVILFLAFTSFYGCYTLSPMLCLRPKRKETSMKMMTINCAIVLLLCSALPVLARVLGKLRCPCWPECLARITNFDLLGEYGRFKWLGNFAFLLAYNGIFTLAMGFSFFTSVGVSVRQKLEKYANSKRQPRSPNAFIKENTLKNGYVFPGSTVLPKENAF
ncbi:limb region 1 [Trichuris trichiura]|uniref:Limb region 1 n=1 Tax=Trichuris trichiura TaxID=36087 RepID=A0A077ZP06_TRITR|nr:limb region 1 [Trichuris trichiura]